jgi:hypothetical protein
LDGTVLDNGCRLAAVEEGKGIFVVRLRLLRQVECKSENADLVGGSRTHLDVGPIIPSPVGHIYVDGTRCELVILFRVLPQGHSQSIIGPRQLRRLEWELPHRKSLPVRLTLIKTPLDCGGKVFRDLGILDLCGIQVLLKVKRNLGCEKRLFRIRARTIEA